MPAVVHTKPDCVQCDQTKKIMERDGIPFVTVEMDANTIEGFKAQGLLSAPVVVSRIGSWAGFRPDKINELKAHYEANPLT